MKKSISILLSVFLIAVFIAGCVDTYPKNIKAYPFNTAIIQYELTGATSGDETAYYRGDQKAVHRFVTQNDVEENKLELNLGDTIYIADLDEMTATKSDNKEYGALKAMNKEEQEEYLIRKELGLKEGAEMPEVQGITTVAGQECDTYEIPNLGTACIWNGIVLEKEIIILGVSKRKSAISVDLNVDIPKERFDLPAGVVVTN